MLLWAHVIQVDLELHSPDAASEQAGLHSAWRLSLWVHLAWQELAKAVELVPGFMDTPLLVWALKRTPGALDRVYFERSLGLNRHWLQVWTPCAGRLCHVSLTHTTLQQCMNRIESILGSDTVHRELDVLSSANNTHSDRKCRTQNGQGLRGFHTLTCWRLLLII